MRAICLYAGTLLLTAIIGRAQPASPLVFEVASVKPSPPDAQCGMIHPLTGGGLQVECITLQTMLTWACNVRDFQISGGPSWIRSLRWDILAKPAADGAGGVLEFEKMSDGQQKRTLDETRQRLLALLADRFQLAMHTVTKEMPLYALTAAKTGSKLSESSGGVRGSIRRGAGMILGQGATTAAFSRIFGGRPWQYGHRPHWIDGALRFQIAVESRRPGI